MFYAQKRRKSGVKLFYFIPFVSEFLLIAKFKHFYVVVVVAFYADKKIKFKNIKKNKLLGKKMFT